MGAVLLAALVAVSACGADSDGGSELSGDCGEPIKIGAITPLTGPTASVGAVGKAGLELGVEHVNGNGGVLGCDLELVLIDTAGDPVQATSAVRRLVEREGVDVLFNAGATAEALAVIDYLEGQEILNLLGQSTLDSLIDPEKYPYTYRFGPKSSPMAQGMGQIAIDRGYQRVVIAHDTIEATKAGAVLAGEYMESNGVPPVGSVEFAADATDKTAAAQQVKGLDPDAIIVSSFPATYAKFFEALKREDVDVPVIAFITATVPEMIELGGDDVPAVVASSVMNKPFWRADLEQPSTFLEEYEAKFGKTPNNTTDVHVYDSVLVWAAAAEEAGSTESADVKAALDSGKEFTDTGTKPISFSETNHEVWGAVEDFGPVYLVETDEATGAGALDGMSWLDEATLEEAGVPVPGT